MLSAAAPLLVRLLSSLTLAVADIATPLDVSFSPFSTFTFRTYLRPLIISSPTDKMPTRATDDLQVQPAKRQPDPPERKRSRIARRCRQFCNKLPMVPMLKKKLKDKTDDLQSTVQSTVQPLHNIDLTMAAKYGLPHHHNHTCTTIPDDDETADGDETADETFAAIQESADAAFEFAEQLGELGGSSDLCDTLLCIVDVVSTIFSCLGDLLSAQHTPEKPDA
ncbi:hypothetical protein CHU98_g10915 [Xylaria longipes]|nr:hypothetical protein CHU98_g10915 [Xylaria longipes]